MESYFPKDKIVLTGNPCRQDLIVSAENRKKGYEHFNLDPKKRTILMLGGSLGAATLNKSIVSALDKLRKMKMYRFYGSVVSITLKICRNCRPKVKYLTISI